MADWKISQLKDRRQNVAVRFIAQVTEDKRQRKKILTTDDYNYLTKSFKVVNIDFVKIVMQAEKQF